MGSVLIIDADEGFSGELHGALAARGLEVHITGDGKAGLDLARINIPDAIVLCVELPRMSGYSICAKLKKDSTLKTVPLIITSAEATQETFEHHKKLKTRAEEYMKKPFEPDDLLQILSGYVTVSESAEEVPISEELSIDGSPETLNDDEVFDAHEGSGMASIDQEIQNLSNEELPPPDLAGAAALQDSFDEEDVMTTVGALPPDEPVADDKAQKELQKLKEQLAAERDARTEAERQRDEATANEKAAAAQLQKLSSSQPPTAASTGREVLELKKQLNAKDREIFDLKEQLQKKERETLEQRDKEMELEGQVVEAQEAQAAADGARSDAEAKLAAAEARMHEMGRSSKATIDDLNRQLSAANSQAAELDSAVQSLQNDLSQEKERAKRLESEQSDLQSKVGQLENELQGSRAEADNLRRQLATTQEAVKELEGQVSDLQGSLGSANDEIKNLQSTLLEAEDRLSRAYQKIREDEEVKSKAKKALEIASALLVEAGFSTDGEPPEDVDKVEATS